ncbi:hypothetical protein LQW54_001730 [Pestalotiopsis sp. IQ-011]
MASRASKSAMSVQEEDLMQLTLQLRNKKENDKNAKFHGDNLIGNPTLPQIGWLKDLVTLLQLKNWPALGKVADGLLKSSFRDLDVLDAATIAGSLDTYSPLREYLVNRQVKDKYDRMLHPPLTYLGNAFQYRTADGKFNSALNPHLGQAGAPYAKTVPSLTAPLGALPDAGDLFDKLMAREEGGRPSKSGLSAMLLYHATIIIHDIFRTNDKDKNISDSSSYLDLSPLYGYSTEMQRMIRDDKYRLGLLKPDAFAEDRLLRQPPGVCIMLVMYNRYHNYAARQLLRINENGRFSIPQMYKGTKLVSKIKALLSAKDLDAQFLEECNIYEDAFEKAEAKRPRDVVKSDSKDKQENAEALIDEFKPCEENWDLLPAAEPLKRRLRAHESTLNEKELKVFQKQQADFDAAWEAARNKQDDDLFNTARLITCGMYVQISVHDYLRALMGFHQFNTTFTLDPRADFDQRRTSRGIGNQVTVEFNLLYRFHCAISQKDEQYTKEFMENFYGFDNLKNPENSTLPVFLGKMKQAQDKLEGVKPTEPWNKKFGIPESSKPATANGKSLGVRTSTGPVAMPEDAVHDRRDSAVSMSDIDGAVSPKQALPPPDTQNKSNIFGRDPFTNLFDDQQMLNELTSAMDDPISNFGPRNVPRFLKAVEIMGILQARKWEVGTLNDFREFFGLVRHETFESVTQNVEIQDALRDLYENPDKIELYPGIFCESDEFMGLDPGPSQASSALWTAIFSDAITLVRSDHFYTVDWNTNSLTSWGMKEVTPNNEVCKSSVFHRLLQRAFPGWFPRDTIRFFHPFYTAQQNAAFATAQGYASQFRETAVQTAGRNPKADVSVAPLEKPHKPVYLDKIQDIRVVLEQDGFTNPAYYYKESLPAVVKEVLNPSLGESGFKYEKLDAYIKGREDVFKRYLEQQMREIVKRDSVSMTNSIFQIDATRDFAIPVVTRFVAAFLGFDDRLCTVANEPHKMTENQVNQHITNCQIFLSYNADETKWMARRQAFTTSMDKLIDLTHQGTVLGACCNPWSIGGMFEKKNTNPMHELGLFVAKHVLGYVGDRSRAAAIMVLVGLDFAYNSVNSFSAILDNYMPDPHAAAGTQDDVMKPTPEWTEIQHLAWDNHDSALKDKIQAKGRDIIRRPVVRKATADGDYPFGPVVKGQTFLLRVSKAMKEAANRGAGGDEDIKALHHRLGIADKHNVFSPKAFATLALTSMIKFVALMKNPRRGHGTQGRLKKILVDETQEGYANFMAPERMAWISQHAPQDIWDKHKLTPETDAYLTPSWDEFVPFPMTWKIRFNGFGKSHYDEIKTIQPLPDSIPPWYQPQGASTVGGTFATVECVCAGVHHVAEDDTKNKMDKTAQHDTGEATTTDQVKQEQQCPCLGHPKETKKQFNPAPPSIGCGGGH